jgi:hypothetical protein
MYADTQQQQQQFQSWERNSGGWRNFQGGEGAAWLHNGVWYSQSANSNNPGTVSLPPLSSNNHHTESNNPGTVSLSTATVQVEPAYQQHSVAYN